MKPYDICAERFHFAKIMGEAGPIVLPNILHQTARVAIVQSPWLERLPGEFMHEAVIIGGNDDPLRGITACGNAAGGLISRPASGRSGKQEKRDWYQDAAALAVI